MKDKFDMTIFYFFGCVIISSAIVIFFSRKASVYSYGTMSITLFSLFFLIYSFIRNKPIPKINFREILGIIEYGFPVFLLFLVTSWLFFINMKYYDRIQSGNLSQKNTSDREFKRGTLGIDEVCELRSELVSDSLAFTLFRPKGESLSYVLVHNRLDGSFKLYGPFIGNYT